ncbi:MAG TPA: hypothetical protein VK437_02110 [Steroidobacteraceae bacterium]|nr:hypothetical protein [Steroidobacteraceae bacterium]
MQRASDEHCRSLIERAQRVSRRRRAIDVGYQGIAVGYCATTALQLFESCLTARIGFSSTAA